MRIFLRILGIILIVLSLLLLIVSLPAGIIGIIIGVFCIIRSSKKYADKITASIEIIKNRADQTSIKSEQQSENDVYQGETVFIEYEDYNGNFSNRTIEIKKVYKGRKIIYRRLLFYGR